MKNITVTNTTQITRVRFGYPQAADLSLTIGTCGGWHAPMHKAFVLNDVAYFRPGRLLA